MPAFRDAMNDRQIAELAAYMRERYAPAKAAWAGLDAEIARLRASGSH
jgi:nicotinate dehydrogenase subunit B